MLGNLAKKQIETLLKEGISPEVISEQLEIPLELVKYVGLESGDLEDRDINDQELSLLRKHALNLALGAEDESVQSKMTMFLIERDKPSRKVAEVVSPITMINNAIVTANENFEKLIASMNGKSSSSSVQIGTANQTD